MLKLLRTRRSKPGAPPGALPPAAEPAAEPTRLSYISYNEQAVRECEDASLDECCALNGTPGVTWINVEGLRDTDRLETLGAHFGLHPLVLEDILQGGQRPKLDDLEGYLFVVVRMLEYDDQQDEITADQVSLALGRDFALSFQETVGDVFDPVRDRIRGGKGRIRRLGPDYLAYALLDAIVDGYFLILEKLGERLESLEDDLVADPSPETLQAVYRLKRELTYLRTSVWPLREVIGALERGDSPLIQPTTRIYLRDVYDHTIQVIETLETYRDMAAGMLDIYLSSVSNRMNEVMKVLTVIATLFIPLTFLAGVYGMNFKYMPELEQPWAYPAVWGVMVAVAIAMLAYFRRKRWF
jgi:magnesium transporter